MADQMKNTPEPKSSDVEIEPLSDEALESVAGGASMCSYAACSNKD